MGRKDKSMLKKIFNMSNDYKMLFNMIPCIYSELTDTMNCIPVVGSSHSQIYTTSIQLPTSWVGDGMSMICAIFLF